MKLPTIENWVTCPVCLGRYVSKYQGRWKVGFKNKKVPVCAWCSSRGGSVLILFIQFVEHLSTEPCETDQSGCGCAHCTARMIMSHRAQRVGDQTAPIKI